MYTHARTHTHALDGSAAVNLALAKAVVYYSIHKSGFLKFLCSMYCGSCSMYFLNFIMTHPFYSFILLNTALWILRFSVMTNDALLQITLSRKNVRKWQSIARIKGKSQHLIFFFCHWSSIGHEIVFRGRFLDAPLHLYKMVCPSVCPSVGPSVRL